MEEIVMGTASYPQRLVVGEPIFDTIVGADISSFFAPAGQIGLFQKLVLEANGLSFERKIEILREEYLSILYALKDMGLDDFGVISSHSKFDNLVRQRINKEGICSLVRMPSSLPGSYTSYPTDMMRCFPDAVFINSGIFGDRGIKTVGGCQVKFSPYGMGGRILDRGRTVIVGDLIVSKGGNSCGPQFDDLKGLGLEIGIFPTPLSGKVSLEGEIMDQYGKNDHLDREACMLSGKDGLLYLLVDAGICTGEKIEGKNEFIYPDKSLEKINKMCAGIGVRMIPVEISIPYALNMVQFPDGRVLMTGGDEKVYDIVEGIVGAGNVTATRVHIRYYPLFGKAGIRCMMTYIPECFIGKMSNYRKVLSYFLNKIRMRVGAG